MPLPRTYTTAAKRAKRKAETAPEADIGEELPKKVRLGASQPSSKPKLARDLSQIFDDAASELLSNSNSKKNAQSSPGRVAKRMLGRSKTESALTSEPATPSSSRIVAASSLPSFPSPNISHSLPPSPGRQQPEVQVSPSRRNVLKRTYAGKSRTFLMAIPLDPSTATSLEDTMQEEEDDYLGRESYNALRERWGIANSEDDPLDPSDSVISSVVTTPKSKGKGKMHKAQVAPPDEIKPFKSITEIRDKGESRRFLDDVGYLLEGMNKDESPALRRSSALEVTNRLCEVEFARKARAADFLLRTWEAFVESGAGTGEDKVLDVIFAYFCALVARDAASLSDLVERARLPMGSSSSHSDSSPFITTLLRLLAVTNSANDILHLLSQSSIPTTKLKKLGVMKNDRILLQSLRESITNDSDLSETHTVSTLSLITYTLACVQPIFLSPAQHMRPILESLRAHLTPLIVDPHATTLSLSNIPFTVIQDLLGLFDSYLLRRWAPAEDELDLGDLVDKARREWLAQGLVGLGIQAEAVLRAARHSDDDLFSLDEEPLVDLASAPKCTELVLRLLVSLTHADRDWSRTILQDSAALNFIVGEICQADDVRWKHRPKPTKGNRSVKKEEKNDEWGLDAADTDDGHPGDDKNLGDGYSPAQALDRLCLALGLLTNLVQNVDDAKDVIRESRYDPKCIRQLQPCVHTCQCPNPTSILNILVDVYHHQIVFAKSSASAKVKQEPSSPSSQNVVKIAEAEVDASFLLGHLSVLFGLLMISNRVNQRLILDALPLDNGSSSSRVKLDRMVENAKALAAFYAKIDDVGVDQLGLDSQDVEGWSEVRPEDKNVAQHVVSFLERLRDDQR